MGSFSASVASPSQAGSAAPGSAEFVAIQLGPRALGCNHFPKYRSSLEGNDQRYPAVLGFFHQSQSRQSKGCVSILETCKLCVSCLFQATPDGYVFWSGIAKACSPDASSRKKENWLASPASSGNYPPFFQAGVEGFSGLFPGAISSTPGLQPSIVAIPKVPGAKQAWGWIDAQRKPFYIDQLHLAKRPWSHHAEKAAELDVAIVQKFGIPFTGIGKQKAPEPKSSTVSSPPGPSHPFARPPGPVMQPHGRTASSPGHLQQEVKSSRNPRIPINSTARSSTTRSVSSSDFADELFTSQSSDVSLSFSPRPPQSGSSFQPQSQPINPTASPPGRPIGSEYPSSLVPGPPKTKEVKRKPVKAYGDPSSSKTLAELSDTTSTSPSVPSLSKQQKSAPHYATYGQKSEILPENQSGHQFKPVSSFSEATTQQTPQQNFYHISNHAVNHNIRQSSQQTFNGAMGATVQPLASSGSAVPVAKSQPIVQRQQATRVAGSQRETAAGSSGSGSKDTKVVQKTSQSGYQQINSDDKRPLDVGSQRQVNTSSLGSGAKSNQSMQHIMQAIPQQSFDPSVHQNIQQKNIQQHNLQQQIKNNIQPNFQQSSAQTVRQDLPQPLKQAPGRVHSAGGTHQITLGSSGLKAGVKQGSQGAPQQTTQRNIQQPPLQGTVQNVKQVPQRPLLQPSPKQPQRSLGPTSKQPPQQPSHKDPSQNNRHMYSGINPTGKQATKGQALRDSVDQQGRGLGDKTKGVGKPILEAKGPITSRSQPKNKPSDKSDKKKLDAPGRVSGKDRSATKKPDATAHDGGKPKTKHAKGAKSLSKGTHGDKSHERGNKPLKKSGDKHSKLGGKAIAGVAAGAVGAGVMTYVINNSHSTQETNITNDHLLQQSVMYEAGPGHESDAHLSPDNTDSDSNTSDSPSDDESQDTSSDEGEGNWEDADLESETKSFSDVESTGFEGFGQPETNTSEQEHDVQAMATEQFFQPGDYDGDTTDNDSNHGHSHSMREADVENLYNGQGWDDKSDDADNGQAPDFRGEHTPWTFDDENRNVYDHNQYSGNYHTSIDASGSVQGAWDGNQHNDEHEAHGEETSPDDEANAHWEGRSEVTSDSDDPGNDQRLDDTYENTEGESENDEIWNGYHTTADAGGVHEDPDNTDEENYDEQSYDNAIATDNWPTGHDEYEGPHSGSENGDGIGDQVNAWNNNPSQDWQEDDIGEEQDHFEQQGYQDDDQDSLSGPGYLEQHHESDEDENDGPGNDEYFGQHASEMGAEYEPQQGFELEEDEAGSDQEQYYQDDGQDGIYNPGYLEQHNAFEVNEDYEANDNGYYENDGSEMNGGYEPEEFGEGGEGEYDDGDYYN
ncbi:unnamed protein product [Clonostachys rosea]|uniref:WW domain-containing protein n=1 Tax=Bionectria ochroleuca TaxID=29856 RepID=A0ABY6V1B4_BIOOC|nr:unnamed protein product [Clonostachys rosea]